MNKIILMGRIVNDLELKTTPAGVSVCSFRIAVDRNYQKKGEERVTDFFNVTAWRNTAEFIYKYFGKGRLILIEGELQTRQYTDKNGNQATWYEVIVDSVHFTGEKKGDGGQVPVSAPTPSESASYSSNGAVVQTVAADDDYPF